MISMYQGMTNGAVTEHTAIIGSNVGEMHMNFKGRAWTISV